VLVDSVHGRRYRWYALHPREGIRRQLKNVGKQSRPMLGLRVAIFCANSRRWDGLVHEGPVVEAQSAAAGAEAVSKKQVNGLQVQMSWMKMLRGSLK
jgi:hypothetical protein